MTFNRLFPLAFRSAVLALTLSQSLAHAALFDDDEARRAILDLRQKVDAIAAKQAAETQRVANSAADEQAQLRRSLFDLQSQIDALKQDLATLRGQNENLTQQIVSLQRNQKDLAQGVEKRLSVIEPSDVTLDGKTFKAEPAETKDYEAALAQFRQGDFAGASKLFVAFVGRYPVSRSRRTMWMYRDGDDLGRDNRIRLLGGANREVVRAILVIEELVGQDQLIVVPEAIESPNRVGVIGPAFIAWDMPPDRPFLAAIEGLVESQQVVVTLGADEPLGGADQVLGVGGIDPDVGLRVIFDQHRRGCRIAGVAADLGRIGTEVFTSGASTVAG